MLNITLKQSLLFLCICCKPPVFLTLSILTVSCLLTIISIAAFIFELSDCNSGTINFIESNLVIYCFLAVFGFGWVLFFASLAKYEISGEFPALQTLFRHSEKGFRCIPVTVLHISWVVLFEIIVYHFVSNNLPKDRNFQETFSGKTRLHVDSKDLAIIVYSIWSSAVTYSFSYFIVELILTAIDGEETLIEVAHKLFVQSFVRLTGVDLSPYPAGESLDNPIERNFAGQIRRNEDIIPPAMAEYAATEIDQSNNNSNSRSSNRRQRKELRYYSWNTLR